MIGINLYYMFLTQELSTNIKLNLKNKKMASQKMENGLEKVQDYKMNLFIN